jgi:hypothetical protein
MTIGVPTLAAGLSQSLHTAFQGFYWLCLRFGVVATLGVGFPTSCHVIPRLIYAKYGVLLRRRDDWRGGAGRRFASFMPYGIASLFLA